MRDRVDLRKARHSCRSSSLIGILSRQTITVNWSMDRDMSGNKAVHWGDARFQYRARRLGKRGVPQASLPR